MVCKPVSNLPQRQQWQRQHGVLMLPKSPYLQVKSHQLDNRGQPCHNDRQNPNYSYYLESWVCSGMYIFIHIFVGVKKDMRVEQKVHERGFLCVSLWVCSEQSRLKFFSEMAKVFFFCESFGESSCIHV